MRVGSVLRDTVLVSALIAALLLVAGVATGRAALGLGLGAGLLIGSTNGHLVLATLRTRASFALVSVARLIALGGVAVAVALLLGPYAWSVLIGVAAAQAVMVGAAVRQGLRA